MKKISIIIPFHWSQNWSPLLERCLKSIQEQTFTDYEVILMKVGRASETQNALIRAAKGSIIKILHADDYFSSPTSLQHLVDNFGEFDYWMCTGCLHTDGNTVYGPHMPEYTHDIHTGNNRIGSPSVLAFRNELGVYFDEGMDWTFDIDFYKKLFLRYGHPKLLLDLNVIIGLHPHQLTHHIPVEQKQQEVELMKKRYV